MDKVLEKNLAIRVAVGDIATRSAQHFGEQLAVHDGNTRLTFKEVNRLACRFGQALIHNHLTQQPLALMSRNRWPFFVSYFGAAKAGVTVMPLNLGLDPATLAYCLNDAGAEILVAEKDLAPLAEAVIAQVPGLKRVVWFGSDHESLNTFQRFLDEGEDTEPEVLIADRDPVQLLYTSGTTARPKGVLTSHLAVSMTALGSALQNHLTADDHILHVLPLFHCADLNAFAMPAFVTGSANHLLTSFDPAKVADLIETERLSYVFLLPMMWQALLSLPDIERRDFSSVRRAVFAMAPMPDERIREISRYFPHASVLLGSGQTEFTPPTTFQHPRHQGIKSGSWGPPVLTVDARIMNDEGKLLEPGEIGEIVYRGAHGMTEYLHRPEETEASFRYGWFHSGDVGWQDEEGVIWFVDRKKDMVKTGGENVSSIEVERCLLTHPAVMDASVIGLPHPHWGEAVTAFVILKPGMTANTENLVTFCKEHLAGFKIPKHLEIVADFPRTGTGKIQKHLLRQTYRSLYDALS
ncbi:MAG: AMP-binding protein [Firmicutes bacterium]|jgi:long-chain acyl-CoA synthetase|uniref:AMP-dependent synthetase n=1 Tax=Sulfobacillus benefaciens TaxID=453960 RepID=A0A2T2X952_9FIRM|nr:AMP-binding protein [Bacillota bacterium]MCL5015437.1 AMP-binding protein [Bacillota bacterium]PSR31022.1 MAG: AMP-dependent synthetase [Sulfobacillus benefaciens]